MSLNLKNQRAAIELVSALAKLPIWGGVIIAAIIAGWHVIFFAAPFVAFPGLHFPPLEIFAQGRFQAILSRILHARRHWLTVLGLPMLGLAVPALIVRHGRPVSPIFPAHFCCAFGSIARFRRPVSRRWNGRRAAKWEPAPYDCRAGGRLAAVQP
jgi:hypothetical protein